MPTEAATHPTPISAPTVTERWDDVKHSGGAGKSEIADAIEEDGFEAREVISNRGDVGFARTA